MSIYEKTIEDLLKKKLNREKGLFNGIPFPFPRFSNYLDGFNPGEYLGVLGNTGSGKSRLLRFWMYSMIDFILNTGYKAHILYFALEDPEVPVMKKIMAHYLYTRHNLSIGPKLLNSREIPIPDKYINALQKDAEFYKKLESFVEIINDKSSPNQIYQKVGETYKNLSDDYHIIVMVDNQSNVTKDDEDDSEWSAIKRLSRDIIRLKFCKVGITTITVLQVDAAHESHAFKNANKSDILSLEPNLANIADAKVVSRSMHNVLGLFDPHRFNIEQYPYQGDYNIKILRNRFKSLIHLKSNEGEIGPRLGLLFDGMHEIFTEMPRLDDKDELEKLYREIREQELEKIMRYGQQKTMFN